MRTSYAVIRPVRTAHGDPMPAVHSEHRSLARAEAVADQLTLSVAEHAWVEEWTDADHTPNRADPAAACETIRRSERILARFHARGTR